jgi:hypothetical protein
LGDFLGNQIEIPIFFGDGVFTDDSSGIRVEQSLVILREESFGNSFLDDNFHKLGVIFKVRGGDVFEGLENLLYFVF